MREELISKVHFPASFDTMIDELVAAGVELGGRQATREQVAQYASDYTGEFMLLYGDMKLAQLEDTL